MDGRVTDDVEPLRADPTRSTQHLEASELGASLLESERIARRLGACLVLNRCLGSASSPSYIGSNSAIRSASAACRNGLVSLVNSGTIPSASA